MSDAMRTIVWITGVAFGIAAPGAFAQSAFATSSTQTNPTFLKLDASHDGFVGREEAKRDKTVDSTLER